MTFKPTTSVFAAALTMSLIFSANGNVYAQAGNYKNTRQYKDAFACGKESLESDPSGNSTVSYCIGNSRDPSKIELKAFKDAVDEAKSGNPKTPRAK